MALCKSLSDWEVVEMYVSYKRGATLKSLSGTYGLSCSRIHELVRKVEDVARGMGYRVPEGRAGC